MFGTKSRLGLTEASNKTMPAAPKPSKLVRGGSTKSEQNGVATLHTKSRAAAVNSQKLADSKPVVSNKAASPQKQVRLQKAPSDLQSQLDNVQEELKNLREQLATAEDEKAKALEELHCAKILVDKTNEKLEEVIIAKKAMEGPSVESSPMAEMESIQRTHAAEVADLTSKAEELQCVKRELVEQIEAKNAALSHAADVMKISEMKDEKMAALSDEVAHLKSLLDLKNTESATDNNPVIVTQLLSEIDGLKQKLDLAKESEIKVVEMEALIEGIRAEATLAKQSESHATKLADENAEIVKQLTLEIDGLKHELKQAKVPEMKSLIERLRADLIATRKSDSEARKLVSENSEVVKRMSSEINGLRYELERAKVAEMKIAEMEALVESLRCEVATARESVLQNANSEWQSKVDMLEARVEEVTLSEHSAQESLAITIKEVVEANVMLQEAKSEILGLKEKIESLDKEVFKRKKELEDSDGKINRLHEEVTEKEKMLDALNSDIRILEESKNQAMEHEKNLVSNIDGLSVEKDKLLQELEIASNQNEKNSKEMDSLTLALREASAEVRDIQERLLAKHDELADARAQIGKLETALRNTEENYEVLLDEAKYEIVCLKKAVERSNTEEDIIAHVELLDANSDGSSVPNDNLQANTVAVAGAAADSNIMEMLDWPDEKCMQQISAVENNTTSPVVELSLEKDICSMSDSPAGVPDASDGENGVSQKEDGRDGAGGENERPVEVEIKTWEDHKPMESSPEMERDAESVDEEYSFVRIADKGSFDKSNGLLSEGIDQETVSSPRMQLVPHQKKKSPLFNKFGSLLKKKSNKK